MKEIRTKAILYGFGSDGLIVHSQMLDLHQYYEGDHIFDSWDRMKAAGIVRLVGILFDGEGNIQQEFENTYDKDTGELTGTRSYMYREHLKTDERWQKLQAVHEARKKRQQSDVTSSPQNPPWP